MLEGKWTNITVQSFNRVDRLLAPLATSYTMQFDLNNSTENVYMNSLPKRFADFSQTSIKPLSEFHEEGTLISVKMYDYSSYIKMFDSRVYTELTSELSPRSSRRNLNAIHEQVR